MKMQKRILEQRWGLNSASNLMKAQQKLTKNYNGHMESMLYEGHTFLGDIKHFGWPWGCGRRTSFCKTLHVKNGRKCDQSEGFCEVWWHLTVTMIGSMLNWNHQTVHDILTEELGMRTLGCCMTTMLLVTLPSLRTKFWAHRVFQWFHSPTLTWSESVWLLPFPESQIPHQRSSLWNWGQHPKRRDRPA
jgi:hypothetical protein